MGELLVGGYILPRGWTTGDKVADEVFNTLLALRLQDENRYRRDLLDDGIQDEPGLGRIGGALLPVGEAVAPAEQLLPILGDHDGTGESLLRAHTVEDLIQLCQPPGQW